MGSQQVSRRALCERQADAPPSALPVISPTRREIRERRRLLPRPAPWVDWHCFSKSERGAHVWPISPLVGEMPGRAEGGIDTRYPARPAAAI
ncbi:hypothetical protein EPK84_15175 [Sinorhizobium fredii]|nr:hypothetical protein EPK84_15175 [Sinorhizobium fredii]